MCDSVCLRRCRNRRRPVRKGPNWSAPGRALDRRGPAPARTRLSQARAAPWGARRALHLSDSSPRVAGVHRRAAASADRVRASGARCASLCLHAGGNRTPGERVSGAAGRGCGYRRREGYCPVPSDGHERFRPCHTRQRERRSVQGDARACPRSRRARCQGLRAVAGDAHSAPPPVRRNHNRWRSRDRLQSGCRERLSDRRFQAPAAQVLALRRLRRADTGAAGRATSGNDAPRSDPPRRRFSRSLAALGRESRALRGSRPGEFARAREGTGPSCSARGSSCTSCR